MGSTAEHANSPSVPPFAISSASTPSLFQQIGPILPYICIGSISIILIATGLSIHFVCNPLRRRRPFKRLPPRELILPTILLDRCSTDSLSQIKTPPRCLSSRMFAERRRLHQSMDFVCRGIQRAVSWQELASATTPASQEEAQTKDRSLCPFRIPTNSRFSDEPRGSRYSTGFSDSFEIISDRAVSVAIASEVSTSELQAILQDIVAEPAASFLHIPPPCIHFPCPPDDLRLHTGFTPELLPVNPAFLAPLPAVHRTPSDYRRAASEPGHMDAPGMPLLQRHHSTEEAVWQESCGPLRGQSWADTLTVSVELSSQGAGEGVECRGDDYAGHDDVDERHRSVASWVAVRRQMAPMR